jgi:hypothetical protein
MSKRKETPAKAIVAVEAPADPEETIERQEERKRLATMPEPGPRTKVRIAEATARYAARRKRLAVAKVKGEGESLHIGPPHQDSPGWSRHVEDAFGTNSEDFSAMSMAQLASIVGESPEKLDVRQLNAMLAAVDGMQPANEAEAMLATQMAGTHRVAMDLMARVAKAPTREAMQDYGTLATKLLRTYTTQIEAFAKIRRGGSQKMRVEHVHVYPGGQAAFVGSVTQGEGRGNLENSGQPYGPNGKALEYAPGSQVWCENQIGETLSVSGEEGT